MSHSPDIAIAVERLSKRFRVGERATYGTLRDAIADGVRRLVRRGSPTRKARFHQALDDVSFTVGRGQILGIVGANGAGKSTLLKIISRITEPTAGRCVIAGRVGSLLEVGTGFNPELTGRENIFVNGTLLGMTRQEIRSKFDDIVAFSGIAAYIDTPVKRYSTGMQVRLGFAVAAHLDPEILLLDEVLAVGDVGFQRRCLGKMNDVASGGRTIVFVSHNMEAVAGLCSRAIWLDCGKIRMDGPANAVVRAYLSEHIGEDGSIPWPHPDRRSGNGRLRLTAFRILDRDNKALSSIVVGQDLVLELSYFAESQGRDNLSIWVWIRSADGRVVTAFNSRMTGRDFNKLPAAGKLTCNVPRFPLGPGSYTVWLAATLGAETADEVDRAIAFEVVPGDFFASGTSLSDKVEFLCDHTWSSTALEIPSTKRPESSDCSELVS
jgi:lipopolysaccharide transport system ATP-binding protein